MASVQSLEIADDTKKYITEKLNPILIELTQVLIRHTPRDLRRFIQNWLKMLQDKGSKDLVVEHCKLLEELAKLKDENKAVNMIASTMTGDSTAPAGEEEEEEEDSDDDVDEIPEAFVQKKTGARGSVSAEAYGAWNQMKAFTAPEYPKSDDERARLTATLAKSFLFQAIEGTDLDTVILAMQEVNAAQGEVMIKQGDDGDFLFVIETGALECIITKPGEDNADPVDVVVKTCVEGDVFGELALLYNQQRKATVKAKDASKLWKLDRETFNGVVKMAAVNTREKYINFLKSVPILHGLDETQLSQICDAVRVESVGDNTMVIKQGDPGDRFYIVKSGTAKAVKEQETVMQYKEGDFFGELALLDDKPRRVSVITTADASFLTLERKAFKRLLGNLQSLTVNEYK